MMSSGTPKDYAEDMYNVYFEVGEFEGVALSVLESFVGHIHSKHILRVEFGYDLALPLPCVTDVVRHLAQKNIAIYQIVRGKKVEGVWRQSSN